MSKKKPADRPKSFADIVREEQARPPGDPLDGRSVNRVGDGDLWDDEGLHWSRSGEIGLTEAEALVADPAVKVGTSWAGDRTLEWIPVSERQDLWRSRLRPAVRPRSAGIPADGQLAYVPELWTRVTGERLLLVQTIC